METKIEYAFQRFLHEIGIKLNAKETYHLLQQTLSEHITLLGFLEEGIVEMNTDQLLKATGFDELNHVLHYLNDNGRLLKVDKKNDVFTFISFDYKRERNRDVQRWNESIEQKPIKSSRTQ